MITIYTDGSYMEKERIGGWAAIIVDGNEEEIITGGTFHSKNNTENITAQRMEVQALLEGLFALSSPSEVLIVTDSSYVCDTISKKWLDKWMEEADYDKKHFELWRMIYNLTKIHDIKIERVKAHNGHYYNERCNSLAKQSAKEQLLKPEYKKANQDLFSLLNTVNKNTKSKSKKSTKSNSTKEGFYAVAKGRKVGIFNTWAECQKQVNKFKGAKFKKFYTKAEAENFIRLNKG